MGKISTKKGNIFINMSLSFMVFFVIVTLLIGFVYLLYVVGNDYVVVTLWESTNTSQETLNFTSNITTGFNNQVTWYQNISLSIIDNMVFVSYILFFVGSLIVAYFTREIDNFSWLLNLFYGVMLLLFVLGLFIITIEWLYDDIILNLFDIPLINTPYYSWLKENLGLVFIVQSVLFLLVNKLDFDNALSNQRKKKESEAFDEII